MFIDIELCHIYLRDYLEYKELNENDLICIDRALLQAKYYLEKSYAVQFSVMIDDEEGNVSHEDTISEIKDKIRSRINNCGVELVNVIYESSLANYADELIQSIRPNVLVADKNNVYLNLSTTDRLLWATENLQELKSIKRIFLETLNSPEVMPGSKAYNDRHQSRFWIPLKNDNINSGILSYSCTLLTAVWYLYRLGVSGFVDNELIAPPDRLVNILSIKYLKSEGAAMDILNLSTKTRIRKVRKKIEYIYI